MPHWSDQITEKFVANVANRYMVETGLPAFEIFPPVNSRQLAGYIAKYTLADWLRIGNVDDYKRMGAAESVGDDYAIDKQSYILEEIAFHKDISKDDREEYDNPFDPVNDAIDFVMTRIRRVAMQNLVNTYLTTGVWGTDLVGAVDFTQWSDGGAASTPVDDVLGWQADIQKVTGYKPNKMMMAPDVFRALKANSDIYGRIRTTTDRVVTAELIAKLFELEQLVIFDAVNSGGTDFVFSKKLMMVYTPPRASKYAPSAGYQVLHKNRKAQNVGTRRIVMEIKNDALRIEAFIKVCPKIIASNLGTYCTAVIA